MAEYGTPQDRESVDEVLALEVDKLRFAKRKLRVQRCKTLPSALSSSSSSAPGGQSKKSNTTNNNNKGTSNAGPLHSSSTHPEKSSRPSSKKPPVVIPKGDPLLGARLKDLSKDERKVAKSTDADRIARRLAKKKARNALEKDGVGSKGGKGKPKERKRKRASVGGKPGK